MKKEYLSMWLVSWFITHLISDKTITWWVLLVLWLVWLEDDEGSIIFMFVMLVGLFIINLIYGKITKIELSEIVGVTITCWVILVLWLKISRNRKW